MVPVSLDSEYLSLADAAKRVPGRPTVRTVWRWVLVGCRGVKLRTVKVSGRRWTTRQWLEQFIGESTAAADAAAAGLRQSHAALSARRRRAIERAEAELDAEGI